jgi:hypothetical protein
MAFAVIYTILTMLALGVSQVFGSNPPDRLFQASAGVLGAAVCVGPVAVMIGFVPGVSVGLMGGFLIGVALAILHPNLTPRRGAVAGLVVALVLIAGAHLLLVPRILASQPGTWDRVVYYLYWLAGPSVMVLLGLTWVGWSVAGATVLEGS